MERVEFVDQLRHEAVVVGDHAEEALKADFGGGHEEVVHYLDPGLKGHDA